MSFRLERSEMEKSPTKDFDESNCRRFLDSTLFRSK